MNVSKVKIRAKMTPKPPCIFQMNMVLFKSIVDDMTNVTRVNERSEAMPVMAEKLHKIKDIAEMLNVHYNTVLGWIERKELPAFKFGDERGYRVADSDLQAFIQSKRTIQEKESEKDE